MPKKECNYLNNYKLHYEQSLSSLFRNQNKELETLYEHVHSFISEIPETILRNSIGRDKIKKRLGKKHKNFIILLVITDGCRDIGPSAIEAKVGEFNNNVKDFTIIKETVDQDDSPQQTKHVYILKIKNPNILRRIIS